MKMNAAVGVGKPPEKKTPTKKTSVKQVRCGKCRKTFPKGQGHNARTCGKVVQRKSGVKKTSHTPPPYNLNVSSTTLNPPTSKVNGKSQQKAKKGKISDKPRRIVDKDGTVRWMLNGELHRVDGPAVEWAGGDKEWYQNNKRHRLDGPALEYANGYKAWHRHGKLHNLNGPAIEYENGKKAWWVNHVNTKFPHLCEKAILPNLTDEEFYQLCLHEDYVVRQLTIHNPHCPVEWRTLSELMYD